MMPSLTDERAEDGLRFMATTDEVAAQFKVDAQRLEDEIKAVKAAVFLRVEGSVEQRKALAEVHETAASAREKYYAALLKHEHMTNRRKTEERVTQMWQSVNANRRQGQ